MEQITKKIKKSEQRLIRTGVLKKAIKGKAVGEYVQKCVEIKSAYQFLTNLPDDINVEMMEFRNNMERRRKQLPTATSLKSIHRFRASEVKTVNEVDGVFQGETKSEMKRLLKELANIYHIDLDAIYPRYILLERDGARVFMQYGVKHIPVNGKKHKTKLPVLAIESISADGDLKSKADSIIMDLTPHNYLCQIKKVNAVLQVCVKC